MDFNTTIPIYLQIARTLKEEIAKGEIKAGEKFPSIREVASNYKVNPNTVQRSLALLDQEGIIYSKRGIGSFVNDDKAVIDKMRKDLSLEYIKSYIKSMEKIGYDEKQSLELLEEHINGR